MTDQPETEPHNAEYPYGKPRWSTPRPVPVKLKPVNGFALVSLFLAVFGISIPAIITGHVALYQLSFINMERGKALAWVGLILGYLQVLVLAIVIATFTVQVSEALGQLRGGTPLSSSPSSTQSMDDLLRQLEQTSR